MTFWRVKQFHIVLFDEPSERFWIWRTGFWLIEWSAALGEEHFEPRPRKQQKQAGRPIARNYVLVRGVFPRIDEISRMR
jgi:hypothetical protein